MFGQTSVVLGIYTVSRIEFVNGWWRATVPMMEGGDIVGNGATIDEALLDLNRKLPKG